MYEIHFYLKIVEIGNIINKGKFEVGKKFAPLWHKGRAEQGTHAKGVQFFCPSSTYPAIILLAFYFITQP